MIYTQFTTGLQKRGISHTEIEVEFDRSLMITDGYDPIRHKLTDHIIPSMENAKVIQFFLKELTVHR